MEIFFYYAIIFLFFANVTLLVLQWVTLWQIKEYRFDRMRDFFSTHSGKRVLIDNAVFIGGSIVVSLLSFFSFSIVTPMILFLSFSLLFFFRKRSRPEWTTKAMMLYVTALFIVCVAGILLLFIFDYSLILLLVLLFCTPLITALVAAMLYPITVWQKARIIATAKEKIENFETSVIGITGSFGKSTTKEFLLKMLSQKYSVLATPKNVNVDIGVAQIIQTELRAEHDFFIVEMGAYKIGEIEATCNLTSPMIGVITAVKEQHLSLFGSLEAIQIAKGELLRALPKSGLAVINQDFPACVEMAQQSKAPVQFFSTEQNTAHAYATNVHVHPEYISCTLHIENESMDVTIPLFGKQVLPSILAAATVARYLGCSMEEIAKGIQGLESSPGTMHVTQGAKGVTIIDDHYNSNPDGFLAALDYQSVFSQRRKIVITPGMYELGELTHDRHHTVGSRMAEVADRIIITKNDFAAPLEEGALSAGMPKECIEILPSPQKVIEWLEENLKPDDVLLLEGRVHKQIIHYLFNQ